MRSCWSKCWFTVSGSHKASMPGCRTTKRQVSISRKISCPVNYLGKRWLLWEHDEQDNNLRKLWGIGLRSMRQLTCAKNRVPSSWSVESGWVGMWTIFLASYPWLKIKMGELLMQEHSQLLRGSLGEAYFFQMLSDSLNYVTRYKLHRVHCAYMCVKSVESFPNIISI